MRVDEPDAPAGHRADDDTKEKHMLAGVELGGTKCICTWGTGPEDVRGQEEIATGPPEATLAAIARVLAGWDFQALGIASFGPIELDPASAAFGTILATPKRQWTGTNLLPLAKGKPCAIDTDVNGAALAEGRWGAAQRLHSWAYITVGTGVGVGSVSSGRLLHGAGHSEAGHQRIPKLAGDRFGGICDFHGDCVEGLASGPALAARAGRDPASLPGDHPAWDHGAHAIAMLCHNLLLTTLPQRILIGGGVTNAQPQLLAMVRNHLQTSLAGYGNRHPVDQLIIPPALGARAGSLGSLALAATIAN
jgi:fructokinase